jgi:hypothetical protein
MPFNKNSLHLNKQQFFFESLKNFKINENTTLSKILKLLHLDKDT